jgi:hypothetical protein
MFRRGHGSEVSVLEKELAASLVKEDIVANNKTKLMVTSAGISQ